MSKPIVDVGIRIDISDQIKDLERQLDSLSNRAGNKMTKGMADQVASIQQAIKELQAQFNSINTNKLNRKTFEDLSKGLIKQIDSIDQRTTALEQEMAALVGTMSKHVGDAFKKDLDSFSRSMATTTQNAKEAVGAIDHLYSTFNKTPNVRTHTGIDASSLEKEAKKLTEIAKVIEDINQFNFENDNYEGSTKKLAQSFDDLINEYLRLEEVLKSPDLPVKEYNKFALELVKTAKKIRELQDSANREKYDDVFELDFSGMKLQEVTGRIEETLDKLSDRIQDRLNEIKRESVGITDTISAEIEKKANGTSETKRLTVPLDISTGVNTLVQRAKEIVDKTQPHLNDYPLKLQFVLQSGYSSKKTNKLLSQIQSEIDSLPEQVNKSGLQELFDNIAKDFSGDKELNIKIKANALSETETNINNTIKKIRTTVEKPMEIHPSVVMDEKVTKKLQRELNRLSKELVLDVKTINLFGKNQKGFDEVKTIVSVIDMIMSKAEETKLQTTYVWQVLVDIREILKTLSLQENISEVKTLVNTLSDFLASIQTAYKVLNSNDLDNMFAGIQQRVQSISGALRGNNLKEIKSVLAQFEQYQKLGGSKSFKDLGGTENVQGWLSRNVKEINAAKDWYEAGVDFGQGYVKGIQDQIPNVEAAATKMVEAALAAVQATQDSHSAAKKTRKLGNDFGSGYVEGIKEKTSEIKETSKKAAKEALQGLSEGMANTADNSLISNVTPAIDEIKSAVKDVAGTVESSIDNIEERLTALLSGTRVSSKKLNELLGFDAYSIYQAGRKAGDSKEGIAKTLLQHATTLKQASNEEKTLQSTMDETQEELEQTSTKVEKVTQKLDAMTAAIGRLTSKSGAYNVSSIREVLDGITVKGTTKKGHTVRDNARRSLQTEAEWINNNKFEDTNWENAYKHYLKFIQLFDIYKKNGGTKETLAKYQAYYDRIIGNADTMRTSLTNLLSKLPTDTAAKGFKEVEQASEAMGSEAQQEIKATNEEVTKLLVALQLAKESMLDLSKAEGVTGSVHKKMGMDEYYYSPKSKSAELNESELALKDAIKTMNEAIVNLRRAGITLFNGVPKIINNKGTSLLSDSSLKNLYSLGKHDKNVSLIANALDKYRDTGDQEILKYIQNLASKTKFSKFKKLNGSAIKKELLSNINNILNPSEEKASVKMTQEASASLDDLVSKSQKASKTISDVSVSQKEAAKSTEKLTAKIKEQTSAQKQQTDAVQEAITGRLGSYSDLFVKAKDALSNSTDASDLKKIQKEVLAANNEIWQEINDSPAAAQQSWGMFFDNFKSFGTKFGVLYNDLEDRLLILSATSQTESEKTVANEKKKQKAIEKTAATIKEQASENKKADTDKVAQKKAKQAAQHTSEVAKNTAEIKKNTQAAKENAEVSLDKKFDEIKTLASKYAKPRANAEHYPGVIRTITDQYRKYEQAGGTRPIEDLSKSKTVVADLTAEYEKQTRKIDENTKSKKANSDVESKKQADSAIKQTSLQIDAETDAKKNKTDATKKSTEATKEESKAEEDGVSITRRASQAEDERRKALEKLAAAEDKVYKNEIHNANGSVTATDYYDANTRFIDRFRTRTTTSGYDKDGNYYSFESTKENYEALEKQIHNNDKAITQLTKDMLLNAKTGADLSAWQNRIDALEEYNRILLEIRNNGWVGSDEFLPEDYHADAFDAERLRNQEKDWEAVIAAAQKRLKSFIDSTESLSSKTFMSGFATEVEDLRKALVVLSGAKIDFKNSNIDVVRQQVVDFLTTLSDFESQLNDINNRSVKGDVIPADINDIKSLDNEIQLFLDNNTAAGKKSKEVLNAIHVELRKIINSGEELSQVDFEKFKGNVAEIEADVRRLHQTGSSFFNSFVKQLKSANAQFFATYFSLQDMFRYLRAIVTTVTEVDSALTELRKVSDASTERLAQNFETSAATAKELGSSISHVINVTADWARLGYDVDAAEKLARVTTLFTTVGDNMSADDASSYLISTLQGFQLASDQAESVIDKYNEVANNFAIDTRGIGEALQRSAASFNSANTDLSKSIALVTATNEVVQNPEAVGTLWKTLSARIRGAKTELEELGEEEDAFTTTTSKLRDLVKSLTGFDIMDDKDNFKDIYEIILGIGKEWDNLTDIERASLGEALAGKRNANALYAVLGNLDTLEGAYKAAEESAGSAAKEQENYAKSIQYSLDRFIATLQELETDFLDSQLAKDTVDLGTSIIGVLDDIVEHVGLLGSSATIAGIVVLVKNFGKLSASFKATQEILNTLSSIGGASQAASAVGALATATEGLNYAQAAQILTLAGVNEATKADILAKAGLTAANGTATISVEAFTTALWGNIKALATWLVTNPVGWCILAAGAIAGVVAAYDAFTISVEEATEAMDDLQTKYDNMSSDIKSHEKKVNELSDSYFEMAKGVDAISGKNISLSDDDYKEFVSTNQELAEMFPQLIHGVDEYGNYILDLGDNAEQARKKLQGLIEQQRDNYNYELYKDLPEAEKNTKVLVEDATNDIEEAQRDIESYNALLEELRNISARTDEQLVLTAGQFDSHSIDFIHTFESKYGEMIDAVAKENEDLASRLRDSLVDNSTDNQYSIAVNFGQFSPDERQTIEKYFDEYFDSVVNGYNKGVTQAQRGLKQGQAKLQSAWLGILPNIIGGINFLASDDDQLAEMLRNYANSLPEEFAKELDGKSLQAEIATWVAQAKELSPEDRLKFNDIFDPNLTPTQRIELWNSLQANLPESLRIGVEYIVDEDKELLNRVEQTKKELTTVDGHMVDSYGVYTFFDEEQIDTAEEYNRWLKAYVDAGGDAVKTMRLYREETEKAAKATEEVFSAVKFNEIDDDLESLQSLYNSFRENVEGDTVKVPLDISDVEALREKWESVVGKEEFEEFEIKVTTDNASVADVQNAFDKIATSYARNMIKIQGATKETMDMVKSQMKMDGFESEGVDTFVDSVAAEDKMQSFVSTLQDAQDEQGKMADGAVDAAARIYEEGKALGLADEMLMDYLRQAAQAGNIVLGGDTSWLDLLAEKLGIDIELLKELLDLTYQGSGYAINKETKTITSTYGMPDDWQSQQQKWHNDEKYRSGLHLHPTAKEASKSGGDAGNAYVEAFEKELEALEKQRDAGILSEKEFLDRYRALIEKYFKDVDGYGEEYAERMADYFNRVISYYESVFSAVGTLLDKRISAAQEGKDAAVQALNDEKDAALAAYDAQLDAIDALIDAKQDEIDAVQDEIDKLQEEREERQRNIDLQKAQYELQRAQQQRTRLIYKDGQMVEFAIYKRHYISQRVMGHQRLR